MKPLDRKKLTVSIVTPSFNQGKFIEETIVSVLSQRGDFHLDYIVMDGGSTDNSVEIIRKYDDLLSEGRWTVACNGITYRWTSGKDSGQADAVNKGFALAKGHILGWLNSDDTYLPEAVTKATQYLASHPDIVMVYGNAYYTDKNSAVTGSYASKPFSLKRLAEICYICQPSAFFRDWALAEVGELDVDLQTCIDYDLWIRMGKRFEGRIEFIEDYLATSRMYEENKTLSLRDKVYEEIMTTLKKHFGYVDARWISECTIDALKGTDKRSIYKTFKKLYSRLFIMRYLLQKQTINSGLKLIKDKFKK